MEEKRRANESDFWGREVPTKRNLPAFWSVRTFGQPYNDERLAMGAPHFWKIETPQLLNPTEPEPAGPATIQTAVLRKSLCTGRRLFSKGTLSPLNLDAGLWHLTPVENLFWGGYLSHVSCRMLLWSASKCFSSFH